MRLPGSRVTFERALRAAGFGLLAFAVWAVATDAQPRGRAAAQERQLPLELVRWTRSVPADTIAVTLASAPGAVQRDWLAALAGAGTAVTWSGAVPATAVELVPVADPSGGVRVLAAAPARAWVRLADSLGGIDSAQAGRSGASFTLAMRGGGVRMSAAGQLAQPGASDTLMTRHAVVLGRAEWEARFVVSALEERGWVVDARLAVAPGIAVTQGNALPLDTARQAVVIALDSLAPADAAAVARFVGNGGGAVLSAAAAHSVPLLAVGRVGARVRAPQITFTARNPRRALSLDPILPRGDAIVLERQGGDVVLAARRVGAGRVVQVGYDETWRWRMAALGDAVDEHREWWAGIVAAAAYRSVTGDGRRETGVNPAPLASLVAALGPASPVGAASAQLPDLRRFLPVAALLMFGCLLAEWASRRLRGAA